tara:strand:+ start:1418 stop:2884 length:1467 start_codon:yes stop_codon:yes gene_type:complete
VVFNTFREAMRCVSSDWDENSMEECDLLALPSCSQEATLPSEEEVIERLCDSGILSDAKVRNALKMSSRSLAIWPLPSGLVIDGLGASALALPWWKASHEAGALLPSHYETAQIMQMMQMESDTRVLLIGARGNWWTEILLRLGANEIHVVEADPERRRFLEINWKDRGLDLLAINQGCRVIIHDASWLDCDKMIQEKEVWDRILITGTCDSMPKKLFKTLRQGGVGLVPIGPEGSPAIRCVTPEQDGGLFVRSITMWMADPLDSRTHRRLIPNSERRGHLSNIRERSEILESDWSMPEYACLRDRAGPARLLDAMDQIWNEMGIDFDGDEMDAEMADRLFRMGNVIQNIGMFDYAAEHFGASFRLRPSAEAATMIGWSYSVMGNDSEAMAWCRRAIETDPSLGDPWNDIGAIILAGGEIERAMAWFRAAVQAVRSLNPGHPWSNMARAHLMMRNHPAAFFAAQGALIHLPEDRELLALLEELGADLC